MVNEGGYQPIHQSTKTEIWFFARRKQGVVALSWEARRKLGLRLNKGNLRTQGMVPHQSTQMSSVLGKGGRLKLSVRLTAPSMSIGSLAVHDESLKARDTT